MNPSSSSKPDSESGQLKAVAPMEPGSLFFDKAFLHQAKEKKKRGGMLSMHPGWVTLLAAVGLTLIGISAIETSHPSHADKQLKWLVLSLVAFSMGLLPPPKWLGEKSHWLLCFSMLLVIFTILPGVPRSIVPVRNGITAWINLKFMMFQPSELVKVGFVMALAWQLRRTESYRSILGLFLPFIFMFVPVMLILKQPDMGTAMLFVPALFAMLIAAGARLNHMFTIIALGTLMVSFNVAAVFFLPDDMQLLRPHQRKRIVALVSQAKGETKYNNDIGYQQHKSITLVGAGRLIGYGPEKARKVLAYNKLPEAHNDMIYAVIVNRWGLAGGLVTLVLYLVLFSSMLMAAGLSKDPFARLVIVGFVAILFTQVTINIGMAIGLMPIIGITLPLMSYGGSSLMATFGMLGLVVNFASRPTQRMARNSFEFDRRQKQINREVLAN